MTCHDAPSFIHDLHPPTFIQISIELHHIGFPLPGRLIPSFGYTDCLFPSLNLSTHLWYSVNFCAISSAVTFLSCKRKCRCTTEK